MLATPNFIVAGVNKAGTTSLFTYLAQHPDVCAAPIKETGYFLTYRYAEPSRPWEEYLVHFQNCRDRPVIMEATPGYFYGGRPVAEAMYRRLGPIHIAVLLRDPVERLVSFYRAQQALLRLPRAMSLAGYVAACDAVPPDRRWRREQNLYWGVEGGYYASYLPAWFDTFGERAQVYFFSRLRQDARTLLAEMVEWLELDPGPLSQLTLSTENRSVNYRVRWLQYVALTLNRQGEMFWRRNPGLKRRLRAIYLRLNGRAFPIVDDEQTVAQLYERYAGANLELAEQLQERGYRNLPDWLPSPASPAEGTAQDDSRSTPPR